MILVDLVCRKASVRPSDPRIETGHAIGSIGILAGRSEVKFPDYLRGGGLRDLLYFSREVRVRRRNGSVDIKLDIGISQRPHGIACQFEHTRENAFRA